MEQKYNNRSIFGKMFGVFRNNDGVNLVDYQRYRTRAEKDLTTGRFAPVNRVLYKIILQEEETISPTEKELRKTAYRQAKEYGENREFHKSYQVMRNSVFEQPLSESVIQERVRDLIIFDEINRPDSKLGIIYNQQNALTIAHLTNGPRTEETQEQFRNSSQMLKLKQEYREEFERFVLNSALYQYTLQNNTTPTVNRS